MVPSALRWLGHDSGWHVVLSELQSDHGEQERDVCLFVEQRVESELNFCCNDVPVLYFRSSF